MMPVFYRLAGLGIVENFDSGTILVESLDFVTATVTLDLEDRITELRCMRGNLMDRLPVRARDIGAMVLRSSGNSRYKGQACDQ